MRVLLLEDDQTHGSVLARELVERGCDVVSETDGATGLVRAVSEPFDAVVVSAEMPGMNGFRVCSRIKQDMGTRAVRVLLVGTDAQFDAHRKLPTRADAYFERPVRVDDVMNAVALLGAPSSFQSDKPNDLPSQVRRRSGTAFATLKGTLANAPAQPRLREVPTESALVTDLVVAKSRARALEQLLQERQSMVTELERAHHGARLDRELAMRRADEIAKKLEATEASLEEALTLLRERGQNEAEARAALIVSESEGLAEAERRAAAMQLVSANEARAHAATLKELEALREAHAEHLHRSEQEAAAAGAEQRLLLRRARDEHAELLRRVRRRHDSQRDRHTAEIAALEARLAAQEAKATEEIARIEAAAEASIVQLRASFANESGDELASAHARARSLEQSLLAEQERRRDETAARDRAVQELAIVTAEREIESLDHASALAELGGNHEARIAALVAEHRAELATAADVEAARTREIVDLRENHARAIADLSTATDVERAAAVEAIHQAEHARYVDELAALEQRYVEVAAVQRRELEERETYHAEREKRAVELQELAETRLRAELEARNARALSELEERHAATLAEVRVTLLNEADRAHAQLERMQEETELAPAVAARQLEADAKERFKMDDGVRHLRMELDRARRDADAATRASAAEVRALRTREENLVAEINRLKSRAEARTADLQRELEQARASNAAMQDDLAALEADAFRLSQNDGTKLKAQVDALQEECRRLKAAFAMTEASLSLAHQEEAGALRAELEAAAKDYAAEITKTRAQAERAKNEAVEEARAALRVDLEEKQREALEAAKAEMRARVDDEVAERREQWTRTLFTSQEQHDEERLALAGRVAELSGEVAELEAEINVLRGALLAARRKLDLPTPSTVG